MTGRIDWLRKLDWVQWLALVELMFAYAVIAMPFLGMPWKRVEYFGVLLIVSSAFFFFAAGGKRHRTGRGPSGFGHLGAVAMVMMFLWGQPWWSVPRPQQANDFWVFVWPFMIVVNATPVLLAGAPGVDSPTGDPEPGLT